MSYPNVKPANITRNSTEKPRFSGNMLDESEMKHAVARNISEFQIILGPDSSCVPSKGLRSLLEPNPIPLGWKGSAMVESTDKFQRPNHPGRKPTLTMNFSCN